MQVLDDKLQKNDLHRRAAAGDQEAMTLLLERYQGLARSMAMRMSRGRDDMDDLAQVANLGLFQALMRFDPDRGFEFSTFAFSTIAGELKRYRRNSAWTVHVPRGVQERSLAVNAAVEDLTHSLGRQPTPAELAEVLGFDEAQVLEALDVRDLQRPSSLDSMSSAEGAPSIEVSVTDGGFGRVERSDLVEYLLNRLSGREREIVRLRFFEGLKQTEIAEKVGISQMHVSRTLRDALSRLRVLAEFDPMTGDIVPV